MELQRLKKWFLKHKRELPWRQNPTPYQVWISEVMLQQTQVGVVIDYYIRWMECFPTIEALAKAPLERVMKVWEGLGYYSRARRLHAAAQYLLKHHQGELPSDEASLRKIEGLGPYTSAAILSFAYHQKKAAVDGNVIRVIARHEAIEDNVSKAKIVDKLREFVQKNLPEEEPWIIMEGLIELGALVCKKKPSCGLCPLRLSCKAYDKNNPEEYPVKKKREAVTKLYRLVLVIECEGFLLLHQETKKNVLMTGLWQFPYVELEKPLLKGFFPEVFFKHFCVPPKFERELLFVLQSFTRYQAYLYPSLWKSMQRPSIPGYHWIKTSDVYNYPFSSGHRKILGVI